MRVVVLVVLPCSTAMDAGSVAPVAVEGVAASSAMAAGSVAPTSSSAMVAGSAAPVAVPGATARTGGVTGVGSGTSAVPKKESHESKARSILGMPPIPPKRRRRLSLTVELCPQEANPRLQLLGQLRLPPIHTNMAPCFLNGMRLRDTKPQLIFFSSVVARAALYTSFKSNRLTSREFCCSDKA